MSHPVDAVELTRQLIRCPSVTPEEGGALVLLQTLLTDAGFDCRRVDRAGTPNLFARWGAKAHPKTFGFNGHTDVVPPGDAADWSRDPFSGDLEDGIVWGRGATDMKSGVAAFVAAAIDHVRTAPPEGAIAIAITGDEEGDSTDGTIALLADMEATGEKISVCIVGEPTSRETFGDMMKIGRRGAMSVFFTARGVQGHSAYPHLAKNPVHAMVTLLGRLTGTPLDGGTQHFDASTLQVTTFDTGNPARNVIPAQCRATVNIRFNDLHTGDGLTKRLRAEGDRVARETGVSFEMTASISGESFLTPPGDLSELVAAAVEAETGSRPEMSTSGGTSDARFIKDHCPVVEFGLAGKTMHKVDEHVPAAEIVALKAVYARVLAGYFAAP